MKHNNSFYLQLSRELFTEEYKSLSVNAKWLFVVLNELEQRYTGKDEDYFFRPDEELAKDCGMSIATFKRAKAELKKTDLVHMWNMHYIVDKETRKKSEKKVSAYRIKK